VYLSTYVSGCQLNEQDFDARVIGRNYYQGPVLRRKSQTPLLNGEFCGPNNSPESIPTLATGILSFGSNEYKNRMVTSVKYKVSKVTNKADVTECNCDVEVIFSSDCSNAYACFSWKNGATARIEGKCNSECSGLKVYTTQNWCQNPSASPGECRGGAMGANAFVYFEDQIAPASECLSLPASIDSNFTDGIAPAPLPSDEISSVAASSGAASSRASPIPLFFSMAALFGILSDRRMLILCILFSCIGGSHAKPEDDIIVVYDVRSSLGRVLGQALNDYIQSLGECNLYMSEVMLATAYDGKKLYNAFYNPPSGLRSLPGPKLERTGATFVTGDYCDGTPPANIPSNSFQSIRLGDSYSGLASAEAKFTYKVYKADGSPSANCKLTLKMDNEGGIFKIEQKPLYSLTKSPECDSEVPDLSIYQLKVGCGLKGPNGGCVKDKSGVAYFNTAYQIYFNSSTAIPATIDDGELEPTDGAEGPSLSPLSDAATDSASKADGGAVSSSSPEPASAAATSSWLGIGTITTATAVLASIAF
jgi:hypothetical protein